jgi:uncharacterized membrane protein YecN with MAPEG domain
MRNRKTWLYIKAGLIVIFTVVIFAMPVQDTFRKWLRFGMLCLFVTSFIIDLTRYKNKNG